jgi:molecular chaperone GrpE (heat shock protein)
MNDATNWKVPKWPFLLGDVLLLGFAYFVVWRSPHPIARWEIIACFASAATGALLGVVPFILDYRAMGKMIEVSALGSVSEKIQNLEKLAAQISSATGQWTGIQETVQRDSVATVAAARQIADKMAGEVREFSEFMQKMNDSEKATLRLEVEKLRRGELEWLQMLVRILDHVFALHAAAVRTGDPKFAEPITNFQNACRGTVRRIGLVPFAPGPDESFDAERHQVADKGGKPTEGAVVAETVNAGYTFQGKLLRPALVRLRAGNPPAVKPIGESAPAATLENENVEDQLSLSAPD